MIWKNIKIIVVGVVMWLYKKCELSTYHYSRKKNTSHQFKHKKIYKYIYVWFK